MIASLGETSTWRFSLLRLRRYGLMIGENAAYFGGSRLDEHPRIVGQSSIIRAVNPYDGFSSAELPD
jgi:hypothetical protein